MDLIDEYKEYTLDNGLSIALHRTPTKTVAAKLNVWHGSLNEKPGEEGLAHFLEHSLLMGGSKKYSPKDADRIMGTFGSFNAYTSLTKTSFPFDMLTEHVELYLNYISDSAFNPRLDKERVEEERKIVLREYADYRSSPIFEYKKNHLDAFFGKNSPHVYKILGNDDVISSASADNLRRFHERGYNPNNMDLIMVGNLPKNIERLIDDNFGKVNPGEGNKIILPRNKKLIGPTFIHSSAPELLDNKTPLESSAQLNFNAFAPTKTEDYSYDVNMLMMILGGDSNSRLFQNVRQRKGLAYSINSGYDGDDSRGIISVSASIRSVDQNKTIDSIFHEMKKLQTDLVSNNSLDVLKNISKYNMIKSFETNSGIRKAIELKKEDGLTPEIFLEGMDSVTPESIREAAIKYLPNSREDGNYILSLRDPLKK